MGVVSLWAYLVVYKLTLHKDRSDTATQWLQSYREMRALTFSIGMVNTELRPDIIIVFYL